MPVTTQSRAKRELWFSAEFVSSPCRSTCVTHSTAPSLSTTINLLPDSTVLVSELVDQDLLLDSSIERNDALSSSSEDNFEILKPSLPLCSSFALIILEHQNFNHGIRLY
jgi:hypothetical protein